MFDLYLIYVKRYNVLPAAAAAACYNPTFDSSLLVASLNIA
jgi:hypothetical protein